MDPCQKWEGTKETWRKEGWKGRSTTSENFKIPKEEKLKRITEGRERKDKEEKKCMGPNVRKEEKDDDSKRNERAMAKSNGQSMIDSDSAVCI